MTVDAHVETGTGLSHHVFDRAGRSPWVTLTIGDIGDNVRLYVRDLAVLEDLAGLIERARQDLAVALGLLPSGEPCAYADVFGSIEWNEHDHDECLEHLVDEPVPYRPTTTTAGGDLGTVA
ncbi:hypothetical protein AB0H36_20380 [Kribbella sp. NPDC050820]|uniref:hypothetical protein n=1 Tax=Kribbella sp. NPDC050820 TaxID=3155408 RepID=UPI0033D5159A